MVLGFAGSRSCTYYQSSHIILDFLIKYAPSKIVSGGARGIDTIAEGLAYILNIETEIFLPDWSLGKHAGFLRNTLIAENCDILIAIYNHGFRTGGTADTVRKAIKMGKKVHEIFLKPIDFFSF